MDNLKESLWHSRGYAMIVFFSLLWAVVVHDEQKEDGVVGSAKTDEAQSTEVSQ